MIVPDQMQPDQYYHPSQISPGLVSAKNHKKMNEILNSTTTTSKPFSQAVGGGVDMKRNRSVW
jgi:hypothetical protein